MAYALGFPKEITALLYSMRDWRLEEVRAAGGTPSARAMKRTQIRRTPPPPTFEMREGGVYDIWAWTRPFVIGTDDILVTEWPRDTQVRRFRIGLRSGRSDHGATPPRAPRSSRE